MSDKPKFYDFVNVYDFNCELPGSKDTIQFKPVNTGQLKKLLTYENETNYVVQEQALDALITSSVLTEDFDISNMYIYDRLFLLIEIRKKTKGESIEYQITCPECSSQSLNKSSLNDLELTQIDETLSEKPLDLSNGIKVYLRHMTRKHQIEDIQAKYFPKKRSEKHQMYMMQVLFHACAISKIETPNGMDENISLKDRMYFIEEIPMDEMRLIKDRVDEMAFGLKLEQKTKCVHCGFEHIDDIPIQNNFFG
jgi:cytochrome c-type biogenesis protein CcmH/NrfF